MEGRLEEALTRSWERVTTLRGDDAALRQRTVIDMSLIKSEATPQLHTNTNTHTNALTMVCVKWGTKYGPEYVHRLASGVRRHLHLPHKFVCFTDDKEGIGEMAEAEVQVEARLLPTTASALSGWWAKAAVFSAEAGLTGRIVYIDLDTVITGSLERICSYSGPFATLAPAGMVNESRQVGYNSSVVVWNTEIAGGCRAIYSSLQEGYAQVTAVTYKFDHWLEMVVKNADMLQAIAPGDIREYQVIGHLRPVTDNSLTCSHQILSCPITHRAHPLLDTVQPSAVCSCHPSSDLLMKQQKHARKRKTPSL
ncbi:unnamed protein product [Chrysoparadoxa australica]